jgi:MFS family permease
MPSDHRHAAEHVNTPIVRRRGHILIAAALGATLNPLNSTMVAVALPAISRDFGAEASSVTLLVVTVYLIATLVCQMPAGSIADRSGYPRALTWGRWIFAAGAAAGAFAPTLSVVVVGRVLMAAGGALMVPTSMALVRVAIPVERRSRAFGTLGAVMGGAAAIGPALGGWITPLFGWRWLFAINLPVLLASWIIQGPVDEKRPSPEASASLAAAEGRGGVRAASEESGQRAFDWAGSLLIGSALVLLTMATRAHGRALYVIASVGVATIVTLLVVERRVTAPVLDLDLFARPVFAAGAGVVATQNLAMYSLLIMVPFLVGASAGSGVGLAIVAMTATMALMSPFGGWLAEHVGARPVVFTGGLAGALGVFAIVRLGASAQPHDVGVRLLLVGLGLGLSTGPSQAAGLTAVSAEKSGLASATLAMMRYVGSIAGTVILGFALAAGPDVAARHRAALWIFAGAFLVSALFGLVLPSRAAAAQAQAGRGTAIA